MKKLLLAISLLYVNICYAQSITYPPASVKPVIDTFFKKYTITDDYRWMENLQSPELKTWVNSENAIAHQFVAKASSKYSTRERIDEFATISYHNPVKKGNYYFTYAFYNNNNVPALYIQNNLKDDEARVIVDPNFISHKDKIVIHGYEVSHDSKYLAYQFSRNGSDWTEIQIQEIMGNALNDHLTNVKFSNIAWQGNGFFYSTYPTVSNLGKTEGQTVYYHKVGTPQSADSLIFKRNDPSTEFSFQTTHDERYFILEERNRHANKVSYFYIDYQDAEPSLKPLITNLKFSIDILDEHDGKFIATDFHDDNGSIIEIDPKDPTNWKAIAPAYSEALLLRVVALKDKMLVVYQSQQHPNIVAMDYEGKILRSLTFPPGTSIGRISGLYDDKEITYSYQSYTTPPVVYTLNVDTYERKVPRPSTVSFDYDNYAYKETEYTTSDSVKVPMLLIYKKGIKLDGKNPTLLEAYGGFGIVSTPDFDPGVVYFLSKGGVYAYAHVRGGGELGAKWAKAGKGRNKQNSFSDLVAGAEYLIKEGYTNPSKLAITGASNGGLVVAAAAIQRPDLFKAVVPDVAPLDMIRFENFTIGAFHTNEYGTVKDSTSFTNLYNYSPYNNIKANVNYPAMLIITSENDDRVPPFHSYKFAAKLQSRPAQTNPILLLVNKKAGHNGISDNSLLDEIQEKANMYAFLIEMLK